MHWSFGDLKTWESADLPQMDHFATYDHHHNMVRRLNFLPPSLRGGQVKKGVAYLSFQYIIDPSNTFSYIFKRRVKILQNFCRCSQESTNLSSPSSQ